MSTKERFDDVAEEMKMTTEFAKEIISAMASSKSVLTFFIDKRWMGQIAWDIAEGLYHQRQERFESLMGKPSDG